jgi:ectoine hydroxylase-related dioxygenase (phytanoyl-CoA dioxygenase family)
MTQHLDEQTVKDFHANGVTVMRNVFTDWIETLREGVALNMREPDPTARIYTGENGGGRFFVDYCNWARIPQYKDFIFNSPVAAVGAELMDSKMVQLFHEHVLVKEAQAGVPTPWHQDMPYYCVNGPKTASIWIPLDEVPKERGVEFIAGSHLWDKFYRPQRFNGQPLNENDTLEDIPNVNDNRGDYDIVSWDLSPGDAIAFDYRTIHGAPANNSPSEQRRAFSLRLVGDGVRFAHREGIVTSPPFPNVTLKDGDPLQGEEFPVLIPG